MPWKYHILMGWSISMIPAEYHAGVSHQRLYMFCPACTFKSVMHSGACIEWLCFCYKLCWPLPFYIWLWFWPDVICYLHSCFSTTAAVCLPYLFIVLRRIVLWKEEVYFTIRCLLSIRYNLLGGGNMMPGSRLQWTLVLSLYIDWEVPFMMIYTMWYAWKWHHCKLAVYLIYDTLFVI